MINYRPPLGSENLYLSRLMNCSIVIKKLNCKIRRKKPFCKAFNNPLNPYISSTFTSPSL